MFEYLIKQEAHAVSEKQLPSAARSFTVQLILSGETESDRNDLWLLTNLPKVILSL